MSKFRPGDKVKVTRGGYGISYRDIGKTTLITEVNGAYIYNYDGVRASGIHNAGHDDWIGEKSFTLAEPREWDE